MKLNVGCGTAIVDGWVNVDVNPAVAAMGAVEADVRTLDYDEGMFDLIVSHHMLDELPTWQDLVDALHECRRIIRDDGVMRVSLGDPRKLIEAIESGASDFFVLDTKAALGEQVQRWWRHRTLFLTPVLVGRAARQAGWSDALAAAYKATFVSEHLATVDLVALDTRRDESFFVDLIP